MKWVDAASGIEVLDKATCLALLAGDVVGRLAFVDGGAPVLLPVNYSLDGDTVLFRTDDGTKLRAGPRSPVAFEVDDLDRTTRTGWSVVVNGELEELGAPPPGVEVDPWAGGEKAHWLRLRPRTITGRRLAAPGA